MTTPLPLPDLATPAQYAALTNGAVIAPAILRAASAAVRKFCRWHISPEVTETITVSAGEGPTLFLPTLHLVSVASASIYGSPLSVYDWDSAGMVSLPWGGWPQRGRFRGVTLTITHGWDDVPDVVATVCSIAARQALTPTGVLREQAGSVSISPSLVAPNVAGGIVLLQHEKDSLAAYRVSR